MRPTRVLCALPEHVRRRQRYAERLHPAHKTNSLALSSKNQTLGSGPMKTNSAFGVRGPWIASVAFHTRRRVTASTIISYRRKLGITELTGRRSYQPPAFNQSHSRPLALGVPATCAGSSAGDGHSAQPGTRSSSAHSQGSRRPAVSVGRQGSTGGAAQPAASTAARDPTRGTLQ